MVAVQGTCLLLFGGMGASEQRLDDAWVFDLSTYVTASHKCCTRLMRPQECNRIQCSGLGSMLCMGCLFMGCSKGHLVNGIYCTCQASLMHKGCTTCCT